MEDLNGNLTEYSLPNPRLSDDQKVLKEPQWDRLRLWFELRNRFLGEPIPESFIPENAAKGECPEPAPV
jgi:hypothetical protein